MKKTLQQKLNTYGKLAKGVAKPVLAGVAVMAAADADAAVIYSGIQDLDADWVAGNSNIIVNIDVNGGGNDIKFYGFNSGNQAVFRGDKIGGGALNGMIGTSGFIGYPYALGTSYLVDGAKSWASQNLNTLANERYNSGFWRDAVLSDGEERFLGIRLNISGSTHYGWVRILKNNERSWTIRDWAYEDQANTGILTPGAVPVELTAFRAQIVANAARLFWSTASEENNAGFEVERSTDGKNFEKLAFVEGNGTTYETQEYLFEDKTIRQNQLYYYRLKQMDFDGKFEYTDVVTARIEGGAANASTFYPNPTIGGVTKLDYTSNASGKVNVTVYNVNGQVAAELVRSVESGLNVLDFDFSALSKGNYFVKLENGNDRQYQKLIIE